MARQARGEYLDPQSSQIVHAISRCVRQAFLCGNDPYSGKSYEHRRQWIRERLEFLASVFAIDCLTYAVLSNHLHLILRSRPDIAQAWSDEEVAYRWLKLCPKRKCPNGLPVEPATYEISEITNDVGRVAQLRARLSDISWWMAKTSEKIARMSNKEDQCSGRFWEGRYKAQLILDEASLLACAMYVDLNPIRAAMAATPENSEYTGAKDRIDDLQSTQPNKRQRPKPQPTQNSEHIQSCEKSGWMSPLEINEKSDPIGPNVSPCGRRASRKGFLSMSLARYLELLDWTGRQLRKKKRGSIPEHLAPILTRLGIETKGWCELVSRFGRLFKRVTGTSHSVSQEAARRSQSWLQAPGTSYFG